MIKVGIYIHSGTMAISETSLKDTALMTINEINANGWVMGKNSNLSLLTQHQIGRYLLKKARQLITQDKVAVISVAGHQYHVSQFCLWLKS